MKQCSKCKEIKPLDRFSPDKRASDGASSWCIDCMSITSREWQKSHPDKVKEIRRKSYLRHHEERLEQNRKKYAQNKDYYNNKSKERRLKFPEKVLNALKEWRDNHSEERRMHNVNRRAKKKSNGGTITTQEWNDLKAKYDFTCLACKRKEPEIKLELDHVLPLAVGGTHSIDNAQPLCRSCNAVKNKRHIDYR